MKKIKLIQKIGNEICQCCGPNSNCKEDVKYCLKMQSAMDLLENFITQEIEGVKMIPLRYKERFTYPVPIEEDTEDNIIYEVEIKEKDTYIKKGIRYYDMICGFGTTITLPVD